MAKERDNRITNIGAENAAHAHAFTINLNAWVLD